MPATLNNRLEATRKKFIEAGGHTTQSFGFGRIIGQIYALLYLHPQPMCLDDIASELGVSKASVSISIRQLEAWSAVKRVWVKGDRRDYYEAETDFNQLLRNGFLEMIRKKLNTAGNQIASAESALASALAEAEEGERAELETVANRLRRAKEFHQRLSDLLNNPLVNHIL